MYKFAGLPVQYVCMCIYIIYNIISPISIYIYVCVCVCVCVYIYIYIYIQAKLQNSPICRYGV